MRKRINQMSKPKREEIVKTKPDIKSNKEHKQDVKMMKTEPDTNEEEKASLILGITAAFTVSWMYK